MADTAVTEKETKLKKCIADCWRCVGDELKTYCDILNKGRKQISLIIAHRSTLLNVSKADIEDTELFKVDPNICLKLKNSIKQELICDEKLLNNIICDLNSSFRNILIKLDRIFNVFKSLYVSTEEMTKGSEVSLPFSEMLEALDKFKRFLNDSHDAEQNTFVYLHKDVDKVPDFWNTNEVLSLKEEVDFILALD